MAKLLRVSDRHQITLPPSVMRDAGLTEGSYVAIEARDGKVILEPKQMADKDLSHDDWGRLDQLVKKQIRLKQYTEYVNPKDAKSHLK